MTIQDEAAAKLAENRRANAEDARRRRIAEAQKHTDRFRELLTKIEIDHKDVVIDPAPYVVVDGLTIWYRPYRHAGESRTEEGLDLEFSCARCSEPIIVKAYNTWNRWNREEFLGWLGGELEIEHRHTPYCPDQYDEEGDLKAEFRVAGIEGALRQHRPISHAEEKLADGVRAMIAEYGWQPE